MKINFRYKQLAVGLIRPIIPIQISANGKNIKYEVLIDSGADICLFDSELADLLGIKLQIKSKSKIMGVAGQSKDYYFHEVTLGVEGWEYTTQVGFMKKTGSNYGIVGQTGFFENFVVKFDYRNGSIEITPRNLN